MNNDKRGELRRVLIIFIFTALLVLFFGGGHGDKHKVYKDFSTDYDNMSPSDPTGSLDESFFLISNKEMGVKNG